MEGSGLVGRLRAREQRKAMSRTSQKLKKTKTQVVGGIYRNKGH